ncbi:MAG: ABC transporter permease [Microthrixaceae bacterium]|nr:ABC transporter permease [Microthrixaceae bacterium]
MALRELRRRPSRFATATTILALIAVLLLFLGGLLDGLVRDATGALRAQDADLVVYSSTARDSFFRSRITPEERARVEAVDGVEAVGGLGVALLGGRVPGNGPRDLADLAVFGYELPPDGVGDPPAPGEGYADEVLRDDGIEVGTEVLVGPARTPVTVVGFVADTNFSGQGSLWVAADTWRSVQNANRPDATVGPGVFQSLVVQAAGGVDPATLAGAIDDATGGATRTLTLDEAVAALPGVEQQQSVFNQIIGVTVVVAIVVVALFFALLTVERTALYGVLKAIGARSRTLFAGVVTQALLVTVVASAIGTALAVALDLAVPAGAIPFVLTPSRVLASVAVLLLASVLGCAFSLRRVLRIDPAAAIGSAP